MKAKQRVKFKRQRALIMAPIVFLVILVMYFQLDWLKKNYFGQMPVRSVARIHCDHCRRTGMVRDLDADRGFSMCPVCQGVGYHAVCRLDERDVLCPACGGMGRIQDAQTGLYRPCGRCDGRGLIRMDVPQGKANEGLPSGNQ